MLHVPILLSFYVHRLVLFAYHLFFRARLWVTKLWFSCFEHSYIHLSKIPTHISVLAHSHIYNTIDIIEWCVSSRIPILSIFTTSDSVYSHVVDQFCAYQQKHRPPVQTSGAAGKIESFVSMPDNIFSLDSIEIRIWAPWEGHRKINSLVAHKESISLRLNGPDLLISTQDIFSLESLPPHLLRLTEFR